MFKKRDDIADLKKRIKALEGKPASDPAPAPTLSVPVVDEHGDPIKEWYGPGFSIGFHCAKRKELSFDEVCKALQEMCDIEITYQEIKGKEGVVIYERDSALQDQQRMESDG